MIVVVFRSRLRPENREDYEDEAAEIDPLARESPGVLSYKTFAASDGERVTIAEFEDEAAVDAWRENPRHREAQAKGRASFYEEYTIQVCGVLRANHFVALQKETALLT